MTGSKSGLTSILKREKSAHKLFKRIIHQESLIAKLGISSAKNFADNVMKIVDKIVYAGYLRHRKFKALVEETDSCFSNLSKIQQVRWLS